MSIHVCKQCNSLFEYCRVCVFRPIRYKDNGFCSKECYEASKIKVEPLVEEIAETVSVEEIAPIEEEVSMNIEIETIVEEDVFVGAESEVAIEEDSTPVEEPKIKNETNTYKKKKNKYQVHE